MTLTLVRPSREGQDGGRLPKRPRPVLTLLPAETARLRATLKNLRRAYGTWLCLAEVMGVGRNTLVHVAAGTKKGSPGLLLRAARAAGMSIEALLAPLSEAGTCPACGRKGGAS